MPPCCGDEKRYRNDGMSGKIILINFCVIFKSWNIKGEIKGSEPSEKGRRQKAVRGTERNDDNAKEKRVVLAFVTDTQEYNNSNNNKING